MLRLMSHIETAKWFNPGQDYTNCGACMLPGYL